MQGVPRHAEQPHRHSAWQAHLRLTLGFDPPADVARKFGHTDVRN
jgi:hypothetical protein